MTRSDASKHSDSNASKSSGYNTDELLVKLLSRLGLNGNSNAMVSQNNVTKPSQPNIAIFNHLPITFQAYGPTGYYTPLVPTFGPVPNYMPPQQFGGPPGFYHPSVHPQYPAQPVQQPPPSVQQPLPAQHLSPAQQIGSPVIRPAQQAYPMDTSGQATTLPHVFTAGILHDPTAGA
ncbi:hypothetical protein Tco_0945319 [Tanacetum coccineum]